MLSQAEHPQAKCFRSSKRPTRQVTKIFLLSSRMSGHLWIVSRKMVFLQNHPSLIPATLRQSLQSVLSVFVFMLQNPLSQHILHLLKIQLQRQNAVRSFIFYHTNRLQNQTEKFLPGAGILLFLRLRMPTSIFRQKAIIFMKCM